MNVKIILMCSGEDVVSYLTNEDENSITIVNPIVGVPSSQSTLAFAPWSPILKGRGTEIDIPRSYVVYIAETQDSIVDQYKEMFSPIATPDKKKLIL